MPTICDLKVELKKKGIKGITGLDKAGLQKLLDTGKPPMKKQKEVKKEVKREKPKKEEKKEEKKPEIKKPLLLTLKPSEPPKTKGRPPLTNKSLVELYKMKLNLEKTIKDNVNSAEAERSKTILEKVFSSTE